MSVSRHIPKILRVYHIAPPVLIGPLTKGGQRRKPTAESERTFITDETNRALNPLTLKPRPSKAYARVLREAGYIHLCYKHSPKYDKTLHAAGTPVFSVAMVNGMPLEGEYAAYQVQHSREFSGAERNTLAAALLEEAAKIVSGKNKIRKLEQQLITLQRETPSHDQVYVQARTFL